MREVVCIWLKNVPISIIFAIFCNFTFTKNAWNSKMSQRSEGGGVNPIWDIVPNVLDFLFWRLPLLIVMCVQLQRMPIYLFSLFVFYVMLNTNHCPSLCRDLSVKNDRSRNFLGDTVAFGLAVCVCIVCTHLLYHWLWQYSCIVISQSAG